MQRKELGKTGIDIPEIGLGTWQYKDGEAPLRLGISLGAAFIDTAEMYGTEDIVGKSIAGKRDQVFVATKVSPHHLHFDDVIRAANASLKRLNIKTIDLYQVHWPNPEIPIKETMRAMETLVKEGKVRYIGVSNFSVEEMKEAQSNLSSQEIASNQARYSLDDREIESEVLPYCEAEKITVIAYSPLARGRLLSSRGRAADLLDKIAGRHGKTRSQVSLNWLLAKDKVVVIPKSDRSEHVRENCGASDWKLSKDDIRQIDEAFR
ncbi:MAG TPA: aldo/keto reductase [Nitrososphaerales archaeon]|nr:aldo/keto reductase [Nitrososphaerales archaeon]